MRRSLLLVLAAIALAGCASTSSSSSGTGARDAELSYFPSGSSFVLSLVTDPNSPAVKQAQGLLGHFPIVSFGETALTAKLQQLGIDIRPLFGNPLMVGVTGSALLGASSSELLAVWTTKDAGKLSALVKKLPGIRAAGSHDGATLYQTGVAATVAVDGATAVFAPTAAGVTSALDRHAHGGGISSSEYAHALSGLPQNALIQTFGNLPGLLAGPSAAKARRIPWVAALREAGESIDATPSGLTFQSHLDTSGGALTPAQVPIAPGAAAPSLAGTLPITFAISDPAHVVAFAEAAVQAVSPSGYASFRGRDADVRAKTGVDLNSLLALLTGDLIFASDTHTTMVRATLSDPGAAAKDLAKLMAAPRGVFGKATGVARLGGGLYAIQDRRATITVGVVGNQLVAGKASASQLRAFAAAPTTPVAGAHGSFAFRIALPELLRIAIKRTPPQIVQQLLGSLGDVTGWISASTKALTGSATLAAK